MLEMMHGWLLKAFGLQSIRLRSYEKKKNEHDAFHDEEDTPEVALTYFIRRVYNISPMTEASSDERFPFVFSSSIDKISIISLA